MYPILYNKGESDFTSNGLGRLSECTKCVVTEERNGIYEVEFDYPITGKYYSTLINSCDDPTKRATIGIIHDDSHDIQPFDVYSYSAPISGIVTFYAHHISYRLNKIIVSPFEDEVTTPAAAFSMFSTHSVNANPFTFWTDKPGTGTNTFMVNKPSNIRSLLCGSEGSILDVFGPGDYQFDKFTVKLYANRGNNTGVTIRYGKNLSDIKKEIDASSIYNAVAPYWTDGDDNIVYLPEIILRSSNAPFAMDTLAVPLDLSSEFDEAPTAADLRTAANNFLNNNQPWIKDNKVTVDFVALWQTPEYEDVSLLQRVSLCDKVSVFYPELGVIEEEQKVIKTEYDALLERYNKIELGDRTTSFSETIINDVNYSTNEAITNAVNNAINGIDPVSMSDVENAIEAATALISGGLGGYVLFNYNADGEPQEILIMDSPNTNTAVNVIRMNKNGIGFSNNGYAGPFTTAWTIDGAFNASYITAGEMSANRIKGGTLTLGGLSNGNGVMQLFDSSNQLIGQFDNTGVLIVSGSKYYSADGSDATAYTKPKYQRKTDIGYGSLGIYRIKVTDSSGAAISPIESKVGEIYAAGDAGSQTSSSVPSDAARMVMSSNGSILLYASVPQNSSTYSSQISIGRSQYTSIQTANRYSNIELGADVISVNGLLGWEATGVNEYFYFKQYSGYLRFYHKTTPYSSSNGLGSSFIFELDRNGNLGVASSISATGSKNRLIKTDDYSDRLLYCYETASPMFGDIGEGVIGDDGQVYIWVEPIFRQTIVSDVSYQVFLQKYGDGDCWVENRTSNYFIVKGTPGLRFSWEIKAKQLDYDQARLNEKIKNDDAINNVDYGYLFDEYYGKILKERMSI